MSERKKQSILEREMMSSKNFDRLAKVREECCISIYLHTHRFGKEIVKAAAEGRVEILFIQEGVSLPGTYSEDERTVRFANANAPDKVDLVEKAAMDSYAKDGRVFILPAERMPEPSTQLNALLRY